MSSSTIRPCARSPRRGRRALPSWRAVQGVGEAKLERYGEAMLAAVAAHEEDDGMMRQLDDKMLVSGPDRARRSRRAAAAGRHDDRQQPARRRGAGQPLGAEIEAAARGGGHRLSPHPDPRGMGPSDVEAMRDAMHATATASCSPSAARGTRSALPGRWPERRWHAARRDRAAADGRRRSDADRASALGCIGERARASSVFFVDHQADADDRAVGIAVHPCRTGRRSGRRSREQPGELGLTAVEAGELDQPAHQGTTSPAAISAGRGARPRMALRCGKRPKRSMMS